MAKALRYWFKIDRVYRGIDPVQREILIHTRSGFCAASFPVGEKYLVFADAPDASGKITSSMCSGSRPVERATEDVRFLEAYRLGLAGNAVSGQVLHWQAGFEPRMTSGVTFIPGATIELTDGTHAFRQVSGKDGEFRFENLPPGHYALRTWRQPYRSAKNAINVFVPPVGCTETFPMLSAGVGIRGRVLTAQGRAAPQVQVAISRRDVQGKWYEAPHFRKTTNARGEFAFQSLPEGDYFLSYQSQWTTAKHQREWSWMYYPAASAQNAAKIFRLAPFQKVRDLEIHLPPTN